MAYPGSPGFSTHLFGLDSGVDGWLCGPGTVNSAGRVSSGIFLLFFCIDLIPTVCAFFFTLIFLLIKTAAQRVSHAAF